MVTLTRKTWSEVRSPRAGGINGGKWTDAVGAQVEVKAHRPPFPDDRPRVFFSSVLRRLLRFGLTDAGVVAPRDNTS